MKIQVNQNNGVNFTALTESGHEIAMDGAAEVGGRNKGARPMEVVLAGLGGCSAIDVMLILNKSRQDVSNCEIVITAERADTLPKVFTKIHLFYRVSGKQLDRKKVARAISLSMEKYCSVTKMLEKTAAMSFAFEIIQA
ncbi:OsmC family protein [Candidatus Spongiihabitans sp.]|uniref:OsmC family protein n=1 Tax=Candidatus Spongiihabitans sp. TaxID=3101308 RepID=UPI003C6F7554